MDKFTNCKVVKQNYTLIFYSTLENLDYQFREYVIFDTLIRKSKMNDFEKPKAYLYQYLNLAPNTIYGGLNVLQKRNYITEISKDRICLNYEIVELFEESQNESLFVKIYHKHRKELGLSLKEYSLLYAFYSLSLKYGHTTAKVKRYEQYLGIKEREYHRIKNKLLDKGLLLPHQYNQVKVSTEIKSWFDEQKE